MRFRAPVLLSGLLVAAVVLGAAPGAAQPPGEETRLELQLQDDGDARWTIVATVPLEDEEEVENFLSFAETYEGGERFGRLGVDAFRRAANASSRSTGRTMTIRDTNRSAEVVERTTPNGTASRYGELRVSFTWTSFARIDDNGTMYVGDAFRTENGTWLPGLSPNQTLVVRSPPGYNPPATAPPADRLADGDLMWEGPETFEPDYFRIVYQPDSNPTDAFGLSTVLLFGALALSLAALLLGLYLLWRRREGAEPEPEPGPEPGADPDAAADGAEGAAAGAAAGDPDDEPDLELLSDEERVEHLLEENGGRMKQADIVKDTGWSNAKVSQLLSSMADEDRIDKLRIGRENLISLPDEQVSDLDTESGDG